MNPLTKNLNETVRDICSVSVAPASKSEVRRLVSQLLLAAAESVEGMKKETDWRNINEYMDAASNVGIAQRNVLHNSGLITAANLLRDAAKTNVNN